MRGHQIPEKKNSADPTVMLSKAEALASIGVHGRGRQKFVVGVAEVVSVAPGRVLLRKGEFVRAALIGVSGSVRVDNGHQAVVLEDDFVIADCVGPDGAHSAVEVVAVAHTQLIVINREHCDQVFHQVPGLRRRARVTAERLSEVTIDLSDGGVGPTPSQDATPSQEAAASQEAASSEPGSAIPS